TAASFSGGRSGGARLQSRSSTDHWSRRHLSSIRARSTYGSYPPSSRTVNVVAMRSTPSPATFTYHGRRIAYREHGVGPRALVLPHGLLMDGRMYTGLAPELAEHGNRVITVDMLGHGASDQPHDMTSYSMTQYGQDVIALLDHLGLPQAVVGGTSL